MSIHLRGVTIHLRELPIYTSERCLYTSERCIGSPTAGSTLTVRSESVWGPQAFSCWRRGCPATVTCMHLHACMQMHANACKCMQMHANACLQAYLHAYLHACMFACMQASLQAVHACMRLPACMQPVGAGVLFVWEMSPEAEFCLPFCKLVWPSTAAHAKQIQ